MMLEGTQGSSAGLCVRPITAAFLGIPLWHGMGTHGQIQGLGGGRQNCVMPLSNSRLQPLREPTEILEGMAISRVAT